MHPSRPLVPVALAVALALGGAACGGDSSDATPATTASTTTAAGGATTTAGATDATVSANDASEAEIAAALDAAGVDNAERWAEEVVEYRPYDDADQGFPRLREELAKYGPTEETIDQIVAVLSA